jgi:hypothetical protein
MKLYELLLNEENELHGVSAISIVETGAIGSDFVALSSENERITLAEVSKDKRILMGAALIPNKPIYRNQNGEEFYVFFSEETVAKTAEMFFKGSNHQNATLEHESKLEGMTVFESWLVEDPKFDKSAKYGIDVPKGTWMVSMKVDNEETWQKYVKDAKVFGFSIEGNFAPTLKEETNLSTQLSDVEAETVLNRFKNILTDYINQ